MHAVTLTNLTAGATYFYRIRSTDSAGNMGLSSGQFVTSTLSLPIINFTTNSSTISVGGSVLLQWTVVNATTATISPGIGAVSSVGSIQATPTTNTTYILNATNTGGSSVAFVTITIGLRTTDINKDGVVNLFDIQLILQNIGTTASIYDVNADNVVNLYDVMTVIADWG
jgi:hypothetical protein